MKRTTWVLIALGLALRVLVIFPGPLESKIGFFTNYADLRNYYWPAQTALAGANPYALWATHQSGEFRADMAPLELAIYVATVAVWNDPRAIQLLFALCDALNIALLGALLRQSRLRVPFQIFYACGPLTVYNLVFVPQDKTILLTLTFTLFHLLNQPPDAALALRVARGTWRVTPHALIVPVAALIAAFKWLSVFYLVPLLAHGARGWRDFIKRGIVFGAVVALAHLPWAPAWLSVYQFRAGRTVAPNHIAPAVLLDNLGWHNPTGLTLLLGASLGTIYWLWARNRLDIFETIALATAAGILWTPDMDPVHLSLVVIALLLITDWTSRTRQFVVWGLSAWSVVIYALATHIIETRYGTLDGRWLTGAYSSPRMILFSYFLFFAVLGFYLFDKWRRRAVGRNVLIEAKR